MIKTEYYPKPIPERRFDWEAWDDDLNEDSPIGYGTTEADAISDLKAAYWYKGLRNDENDFPNTYK